MTRDQQEDIDTLARTLYGEAESGNAADACAIAAVIMNRVIYHRWGASVTAVCLQPWQFSCWNHNDPNRARILKAKGPWFETCREIAEQALHMKLKDKTSGSTHYYETGVRMPNWAKGHKPVLQVPHKRGTAHIFFNDIDTPRPLNAKQALDQKTPLAASRTVKAQAAVASGVTGLGMLDEVKGHLEGMAYWSDWAKYGLMAVVVLGIGATLWARYDDRRKGLR